MNFEDMQSAWQQDEGTNIELPDQLEKIKRATSPVEKVKKNIRFESWTYLIFIVLFFFLPVMYDQLPPLAKVFYYTLLIMTLMPMAYYFYNFYKLYGRLNKLELNTKSNVEEAYFDLRYSLEIYKVMHHFISPNLFLLGFVYGAGKSIEKLMQDLLNFGSLSTDKHLFLFAVCAVILLFFVGYFFFIKWVLHYYYGKYLDELKDIKDSLNEVHI